MFEITIAFTRRKQQLITISENATLTELYKRISKHTNSPEKARITSMVKIKCSGVTITAAATAKIKGLSCDMIGCSEEIAVGDTFYHVDMDERDDAEAYCICKYCKISLTRQPTEFSNG